MSFCHLRMIKTSDSSAEAVYRIESPDFDKDNEWGTIGQVRIQKALQSYESSWSGSWQDRHVVPPWIFGLSEDEQNRLLQTDYKGYDCGAWTMRIHFYATSFLKQNHYPQRHPEGYFEEGHQV